MVCSVFNDADLKSVMRQLERWYHIKVQYHGIGFRFHLKRKDVSKCEFIYCVGFSEKDGSRISNGRENSNGPLDKCN